VTTINGWRVSVDYVTGVTNRDGTPMTQDDQDFTLKVFRYPGGYSQPKEECNECSGARFAQEDAAYAAARAHGHLA
jgi:hypothetical protein